MLPFPGTRGFSPKIFTHIVIILCLGSECALLNAQTASPSPSPGGEPGELSQITVTAVPPEDQVVPTARPINSPCRSKTNIPCTRWAGVRCKPNEFDTVVILREVLDHAMGVISGRIIHNDDFQITDRLLLHGRNRATYEMVRIEGGDNDGKLHPPALAENDRFSTIAFFYPMLSETNPPDCESSMASTLLVVIAFVVTATPIRRLIS
jgi:hypothetical protein